MPDETPERRVEVSETQAKQGRWGGRVLLILVAALILVAIAWWGAEIYGSAIAPDDPVGDPQTTPSEPVPPSGG